MRSYTSKFVFTETPKARIELGSDAHHDFFASVIAKHGFVKIGNRFNLIDPSYKLVVLDQLNFKLESNGLDVDHDHHLLNGTIAVIDTAVQGSKRFNSGDFRTMRMFLKFLDGVWYVEKIEIRNAFDGCDEKNTIYLSRHALAQVLNFHMSWNGLGHLSFGSIVEDDEIDSDFVAAGFPREIDKDVAVLIG